MPEIQINDVTPRNQYTASAAQTNFTYDFPIFDSAHLVVLHTNAAGTTVTLTEGAGEDYTVTGVGAAGGGEVVLNAGATAGDIYTIYRDVPFERLFDYQTAGDFLESDFNRDFELLLMMLQQMKRDIERSITIPIEDTGSSFALPTASSRANTWLKFDSLGDVTTASYAPVFLSGSGAPAAGLGNISDAYLDTATGDLYQKTASGWGAAITNLLGPTGPIGANATWLSGSGAPAGGLGSDGDMYLDTATGDVYGPKSSGAWGAVQINIRGDAVRVVECICFNFGSDVAIGDGAYYFHVPEELNGEDLVGVHAEVVTAGTTGTTDIQIHNIDNAVDMLSTKLTIDSGETGSDTAATPAVISGSNSGVNTNDMIRIDVDAVSTTAPKGLIVTLRFQ